MPAFNNRNNKVQPPTKVVTRRQQSDFGYATWLLAHSAHFIKLTFVVVGHKIFWWDCFLPPLLLRPGETAPSAPQNEAQQFQYGGTITTD